MKKALSLILAAVLICGIASVGFAAAPKINTDGNDQSGFLGYKDGEKFKAFDVNYEGITGDGYDEGDKFIHLNGDVPADTRIHLQLTVDSFMWNDDEVVVKKLTTSHLSTAKITVKKKVSKGSNVLDAVEFKTNSDGVYVRVKLIEEFVSTGDQDFDYEIYLNKSGKIDESVVQITGTMKNPKVEVVEDDEEVDLSDGQYAEADGYVKAIKVDTGNGVFINTKMFDGKKYYAKTNIDVSDAASIAAVNTYPEIANIITLNTVGMSSAGNTVEFDLDDTYYVYNADGQYIGTTNDLLPMSGRYYLATAQIDMGVSAASDDDASEEAPADEEIADEEVTDDVLENPSTGGDDK